MAHAINGIGTAFYGQREFRADGSYITTEWFILGFVPIFPLRSLRVLRNPSADKNLVVYHSESFYVLETMRPNKVQVLQTYGFAGFCTLWLAFVFWLLAVRLTLDWDRHGMALMFGAIFLAALPFFVPLVLRRGSKRSISSAPLQTPMPPPLPQRREASVDSAP